MSADVLFLVSVEVHPVIRKVFPPRKGGGAPEPQAQAPSRSVERPTPGARTPVRPAPPRTAAPVVSTTPALLFDVQVAALSDLESATRLERELKGAGLAAYVVAPQGGEPATYRVRIGPFPTRAAAARTVEALARARGEKPWIVKR